MDVVVWDCGADVLEAALLPTSEAIADPAMANMITPTQAAAMGRFRKPLDSTVGSCRVKF